MNNESSFVMTSQGDVIMAFVVAGVLCGLFVIAFLWPFMVKYPNIVLEYYFDLLYAQFRYIISNVNFDRSSIVNLIPKIFKMLFLISLLYAFLFYVYSLKNPIALEVIAQIFNFTAFVGLVIPWLESQKSSNIKKSAAAFFLYCLGTACIGFIKIYVQNFNTKFIEAPLSVSTLILIFTSIFIVRIVFQEARPVFYQQVIQKRLPMPDSQ